MMPQQYEVWLADLNPQTGTESGKKRPVVVIQTNLLNSSHLTTIICPITTNVVPGANILRVHLYQGEAGVNADSDIMIDQIRAIGNRRFIHKIGKLSAEKIELMTTNIRAILDIE